MFFNCCGSYVCVWWLGNIITRISWLLLLKVLPVLLHWFIFFLFWFIWFIVHFSQQISLRLVYFKLFLQIFFGQFAVFMFSYPLVQYLVGPLNLFFLVLNLSISVQPLLTQTTTSVPDNIWAAFAMDYNFDVVDQGLNLVVLGIELLFYFFNFAFMTCFFLHVILVLMLIVRKIASSVFYFP